MSDGEAPPAFLQGRRLVADVTDRAVLLYPLGLDGRFRVRIGADLGAGADPIRRLVYEVGAARLEADGWSATVRVSPTLPVLSFQPSASGPAWVEVDGRRHFLDEEHWLTPSDFELDSVVERNNSTIPDPLPSPRPRAGLLATRVDDTIALVTAETRTAARHALALWLTGSDVESRYWAEVSGRLTLEVPDDEITRQARYSLHSSLFSRSVDEGGRDFFLHGRRDRGYADAGHLHQSYQMHLPALAAGEYASVRDDIVSYLVLQDSDGWIERAPRPLSGSSVYVGRYTSAHLLLALERYISWTGDHGFLDETVVSSLDPRPLTVGERVSMAADDLLRHRYRGLVRPCGWADAWNPDVRAQGQISAAAVLGLRAWARVCASTGRTDEHDKYSEGAEAIARAVREILVDDRTGIVAEHLFDDEVTGGSPDDFWAHTQIWASLAGISGDRRGLDIVARDCLDHGVFIAPESAFDREYVAASTDSTADLPVDSTATWLLARWPEVTHLYALAEIEHESPDAALAAVRAQLPETLHQLDPVCSPWHYAEKYLYPGTRPWLCTWAGDPSLLELLITGFLGFRPEPEGVRIEPRIPTAWAGGQGRSTWLWRGRPVTVELRPDLPPGVVDADGIDISSGRTLRLSEMADGVTIRISTAQSFADLPDSA
ncbi:MAG TPA: hypothetical protein VIL55_07190 [Naasia sp.]